MKERDITDVDVWALGKVAILVVIAIAGFATFLPFSPFF